MKKFIISTTTIISIIVLSLIFKDITINESNAFSNRFIEVLQDGRFRVYYDRTTKVLYLRSSDDGLTVLVDKDGKPLLYNN